METRKIVVVTTKSSKKLVLNTGVETLGELKKELDNKNFDYEGMEFTEGVSKTVLTRDDSVLPKELPFKGSITNDLAIFLTVPNKKIKSGVMSRSEVIAAIKENHLTEECKKVYGKNFTTCKTTDLIALLDKKKKPAVKKEKAVKEDKPAMPNEDVIGNAVHNKVAKENTEKSGSALEERVNKLESTVKKMAQLLSDGLNSAADGEYPNDVIDALDSIADGEDPDMSSDSDSESPFSEAELRAMRG